MLKNRSPVFLRAADFLEEHLCRSHSDPVSLKRRPITNIILNQLISNVRFTKIVVLINNLWEKEQKCEIYKQRFVN